MSQLGKVLIGKYARVAIVTAPPTKKRAEIKIPAL